MKSFGKGTLLALLAVFALGAVASATASATTVPWLTDAKKESLTKKKFKLTAPSAIVYAGGPIACTSVSGEGEATSKTTLSKVILEYHECNSSGGNIHNEKNKGILKTEPLKGTWVWINESKEEIGLSLRGEAEPEKGKEPILAKELVDEGIPVGPLRGYLLGSCVGCYLDHLNKTKLLGYKETKGVQEPKTLEGKQPFFEYEGLSYLVGFGYEGTVTFEEEAQLEAS